MAEEDCRIIPVVDIATIGKTTDAEIPAVDLQRIGRQLTDACSNIGFVYITGHGIPESLIEKAFSSTGKFFELPLAVKEKYNRLDGQGYVAVDQETLELFLSRMVQYDQFTLPLVYLQPYGSKVLNEFLYCPDANEFLAVPRPNKLSFTLLRLGGDFKKHELRESFDVEFCFNRYPDEEIPDFGASVVH
ncbi:UPF0676 protein C1494.01-like, partial [Hyalella azteca]|uniref:UPF0676 protein C1494.01-like n=1 Tax=Hyalella azteca TaxID=294128 RepID=A0A979FSQ6_HYAAZ